MGPKAKDKCPHERQEKAQRRGEGDVKAEADWSPAATSQGTKYGHQPQAGRDKEQILPQRFRGQTAQLTP